MVLHQSKILVVTSLAMVVIFVVNIVPASLEILVMVVILVVNIVPASLKIPVVASVPVMVVSLMVNIAPVSLVVNMVPVVVMLVVEVIRAVMDNLGTLSHVVDEPGQIQVLVVVVKDSRAALSLTQGVQP